MVQAELNGMKYLLEVNANWDFFINLSGQDFPLQSQEFIQDYLGKNRESSFIKIANQLIDRPDTMNRVENFYVETPNGFVGRQSSRPMMKGVTSYIGGQWMILNRECCEFICNSPEVKSFEDFYLNTFIADESFFQTVIMNTSFIGNIINDDKRAIIWIPDGNIKLRPKTFTILDADFLMNNEHLFARKFDANIDENIINQVESKFYSYS